MYIRSHPYYKKRTPKKDDFELLKLSRNGITRIASLHLVLVFQDNYIK